jgi:acetyl esterase/lipase
MGVAREDPPWIQMAVQARVQYCVPGMDEVTVREEDLFDYYEPLHGAVGAAPVVMMIHGGPIPGNLLTGPTKWGNFRSLGRVIAASGLGAVMFNHRFFAPDAVGDAVQDIREVMAALPAHGIATERLCLWAFSGGGLLLTPFLRETPAAVRCVVAYYCALDAASTGMLPPMLIARAGLDSAALNDPMDEFVQQALRKNAPIEVLNHPTGQHAFDCRDDHPRTRYILRRTVEFIQSYVVDDLKK